LAGISWCFLIFWYDWPCLFDICLCDLEPFGAMKWTAHDDFFKQHWLSRHVWNLLELRNVYIDFIAWFRNKLQRGQLSCTFRENDHQAEEDDDTEEEDDPLMGFKLSMFRSFRKWVVYLHHPVTLGSSLFRALARAPLNVYMCVSYIVARHISWRNLQSEQTAQFDGPFPHRRCRIGHLVLLESSLR
jgi:hypothetical protein